MLLRSMAVLFSLNILSVFSGSDWELLYPIKFRLFYLKAKWCAKALMKILAKNWVSLETEMHGTGHMVPCRSTCLACMRFWIASLLW